MQPLMKPAVSSSITFVTLLAAAAVCLGVAVTRAQTSSLDPVFPADTVPLSLDDPPPANLSGMYWMST